LDQAFRQLHSPRLAEDSYPEAVGDIGPVLEEHPTAPGLKNNIETSFEPDEVFPRLMLFPSDASQRFGSLPSSCHSFLARKRRMADAAWCIHGNDLKPSSALKTRNEFLERVSNAIEFWSAGATDGNDQSSQQGT
jgi:hypothetical protein